MNQAGRDSSIEQGEFKLITGCDSAFRSFHKSKQRSLSQEVTEMERYINMRKYQNSFTLSEIQTDSFDESVSQIKQQKTSLKKQIFEAEVKTLSREVQTDPRVFHIEKVISSKIFNLQNCQRDRHNDILRLDSKIFDASINNQPKQKISRKKQNQTKLAVKIQESCEGTNEDSAEGRQDSIIGRSMKEQKTKTKSKKSQKKEKATEKNKKSSANGLKQEIQKEDPIKKLQNESYRIKQNDFSNTSSRKKMKDEEIYEIPFDGVMRNCKCCGKLISKLCFKCPHLYCKAENCPRKRKKILNERMLQRMKQNKIEEHYRQRELYEKIRLQQGDNFNPQLVEGLQRPEDKPSNNQKRSPKSNNNRKLDFGSFQQDDIETEEDEFNSKDLYDSQEEENQISYDESEETVAIASRKCENPKSKRSHLKDTLPVNNKLVHSNKSQSRNKDLCSKQQQNLHAQSKQRRSDNFKVTSNKRVFPNDDLSQSSSLEGIFASKRQNQENNHQASSNSKKHKGSNLDLYFNEDEPN